MDTNMTGTAARSGMASQRTTQRLECYFVMTMVTYIGYKRGSSCGTAIAAQVLLP